jgi:hypothetical protein
VTKYTSCIEYLLLVAYINNFEYNCLRNGIKEIHGSLLRCSEFETPTGPKHVSKHFFSGTGSIYVNTSAEPLQTSWFGEKEF